MTDITPSPAPRRFAILGATGKTGSLVLRKLLKLTNGPEIQINVYARSMKKLEWTFPAISSDPRVALYVGNITDQDLIKACLSGADTIVCAVGENENIPGVRILQDAARTVVNALSALENQTTSAGGQWQKPRLILLSSATWNPKFASTRPALLHWMIRNAFARPYHDLVTAQEIFLAAPELMSLLLVQPNALVEEKASGCIITTEFAYTAVSYEDLAEGFVQLATKEEYKDVTAIGVSSRRAEKEWKYVPFILGKVIRGLCFQFVPGYWQMEYAVSGFFRGG